MIKELKRFAQNRHVYVLVVDEYKDIQKKGDDIPEEDDELSFLEGSSERKQALFCEVALEYTASIVEVYSKEEEKKKYYQVLFENWAHEFGRKLEKRFPKGAIVEQITAMRNPDKSALIEKYMGLWSANAGTG